MFSLSPSIRSRKNDNFYGKEVPFFSRILTVRESSPVHRSSNLSELLSNVYSIIASWLMSRCTVQLSCWNIFMQSMSILLPRSRISRSKLIFSLEMVGVGVRILVVLKGKRTVSITVVSRAVSLHQCSPSPQDDSEDMERRDVQPYLCVSFFFYAKLLHINYLYLSRRNRPLATWRKQ